MAKHTLIERLVSTLFTKKHTRAATRGRTALLAALSLTVALAGPLRADTVEVDSSDEVLADIPLTENRTYQFNGDYVYNILGVISGGHSLTKTGTSGTLGLSGANTFTGGTVLEGGTILLGHDKALGTWTAGSPLSTDPDYTQNGMLLATTGASTVKVTEDRTITNHFQLGGRQADGTVLDPNATLTFDIAQGTTLTISGVENTSTDTYLGNGGAINVNVPSSAGTPALTFGNPDSPSGHLVFADNTAAYGGAVGPRLNGANQHSVFDFRGLESITFSDNIAIATGNYILVHGGGISSFSSSSSVTLGDFATFTSNIAGMGGLGSGGGISSVSFSSSSVELGDFATFTSNIACMGGNGSGGGISSSSSYSSSSVELGVGAHLAGNRAGGNNGGGWGGAIREVGGEGQFGSLPTAAPRRFRFTATRCSRATWSART